jgi:hypothetical protein
MRTGLSLWDLQHYEVIEEPLKDTRALLAWNNQTIVLSFRGTYSMANILTDRQVLAAAGQCAAGV